MTIPTPDAMVEELEGAAHDLRACANKKKDAVESLTGFSLDAIAIYTGNAADLIQQQLATIERLSAEKAEWQRQLGHDLPAWSMRQARVDLRTPLDTVFAGAIAAIETWGAHPDLTSAQSLVSRAWSFINRWIEEGASGASDEARAALGKDASDVRSQREGRGQ